MEKVSENLFQVEQRIQEACRRAGRNREEVTLIAVSKTKPVELIQEAYSAGARDFGENKVQELIRKIEVLPPDIRWHMIGHLQTNKVKPLIGRTALIHSVDSIHLAVAIEKQAAALGVSKVPILIEVNIAGEESKYGIRKIELFDTIREASKFPHLQIRGLMTIAPFVYDPEYNRSYFRELKQLSVDIAAKNIDNVSMEVLSMGMTGDYEVAIEEGATIVRVGTGIFGERNYKI